MKKTLIAAVLFIVGLTTVHAQWGRNDRRDDNRRDDRYDDRWDDRRSDDRWDNDRRMSDRRGNWRMGDRIDDYQREARRRIAIGVETGALTSREARNLLRFAERIERKEQFFWRDRRLDGQERRELEEDLAQLHREITREKRDRDRAAYNDPRWNGRDRGW
ncbi:MAG: hypothetical protein ACK4GN_17420 [Runella sp.]